MVKIAITGGIGSGKSYVCRLLEERGISVYDCDSAAKRLMVTSEKIIKDLTTLVGKDVYIDGRLNKPVMAKYLLASEENMKRINSIVHPIVADDFISSGSKWMECALLFSSGFNRLVDKVICVSAPLEVRLERIVNRDGISREKAEEWINNQMSQDEVIARSDYNIVNDGICDLNIQIENILNELI
ncbi:MAG: dephospho-CoA kinase [Prevotellaceae bacterium]|nr:dephospho-CoA kinase [Prevotellaceae bacterium]